MKLDDSKSYQKILKHRKQCDRWPFNPCSECFGGSLNRFVKSLEKEGFIEFKDGLDGL